MEKLIARRPDRRPRCMHHDILSRAHGSYTHSSSHGGFSILNISDQKRGGSKREGDISWEISGEMESSVIVLSIVVGLFGIGSAVLGFIAEATKLEPNDISVSRTECVYPANPAFALGLVAAILLLVAQITVSAAGRCCGCCKPRGAGFSVSRRNIGVVFSVLSWVAAVIAEIYFVQGAAWNAPVTREIDSGCYFVKDGAFRRAAILSIIATVLGIKSFFLLRAAAAAATPAAATPGYPGAAVAGPSSAGEPKPDGIAMGHPAPMYGQAPYAHYPPPPNAQGYGQYPPPAQGYGFHPAAAPQGQGYAHAV